MRGPASGSPNSSVKTKPWSVQAGAGAQPRLSLPTLRDADPLADPHRREDTAPDEVVDGRDAGRTEPGLGTLARDGSGDGPRPVRRDRLTSSWRARRPGSDG